jgi:hypothetical protein
MVGLFFILFINLKSSKYTKENIITDIINVESVNKSNLKKALSPIKLDC